MVLRELPLPEVGSQDVLVKIKAAGVNPVDNMIIRGAVKLIVPYTMPLVMGNEFVSVVEQVFELDQVNETLKKVAVGGSKGKTILKIR